MGDLAARGHDRREREVGAGRERGALDGRRDLVLGPPRLGRLHRRPVHDGGDLDGPLDLGDLLGGLHDPLGDHGVDEDLGRLDPGRRHAQQLRQPEPLGRAVRRQDVDGSAGRPRTAHGLRQRLGRRRPLDLGRGRALGHRRRLAVPDLVLQRRLAAEQGRRTGLGVESQREPGLVEADVVPERPVLAEAVMVGRVVHRGRVVAEQHDEAAGQGVGEGGAAGGERGGRDHRSGAERGKLARGGRGGER